MKAFDGRFALITAAALLALWATLSLGRWQLSRAAEKEAFQATLQARAALPVLEGAALLAHPDLRTALYRRVQLRGQWVGERTVFLDNRQMNAKVGLYVLTPFQIEGSRAVVMVQRGWVPRHFLDRTQVPEVSTPSGVVTLVGRIAPPAAQLYALGEAGTGLIRQNLDLPGFALETGLPLLPVSVQQLGAASDGVLREWPQVSSGVEKHHGYAFQWFALSGLIALLYVWFQIVRRFFLPRRA